MIARLTGKLIERELGGVVVDVHGVGYLLSVPMSTYDRLPAPGAEITLFTDLHVREDAMTLFGFATADERALFRLLDTVSGIGPKLALNILSCLPVQTFCQSVAAGDIKSLSRVNGIGKRTAERLVLELRDKIKELAPAAGLQAQASQPVSREALDAVSALETLGFKPDVARRTVQQICAETPDAEHSAEKLIRRALQILNA